MAKVITFSRHFPKGHIRAGEPTFFVEKFLNSIRSLTVDYSPKHHTIRSGNRFKAGDKFSPRYWSDKAYRSPQRRITDDIEIKKVYDIELWHSGDPDDNTDVRINGNWTCELGSELSKEIALNDGLTIEDFESWFDIKKNGLFTGQIICWSDKVDY